MLSIYIVVDRIKFSQFDAIQLENNLILCWNRMGKINYGKWRRWKKPEETHYVDGEEQVSYLYSL